MIDVEESLDDVNAPCDYVGDEMEEEDSDSDSHGKISVYSSKLDNAMMLNNKS